MTLAFFVLTQYRLVTDGRTDGQTDRHVSTRILQYAYGPISPKTDINWSSVAKDHQ